MYNRYVPQPDGSFRRNRIQGQEQQQKPQPLLHEPEDEPHLPPTHPISAGSFLKQLIPKGLDTGDLLIIVLLLLMAGECEEEKNSALLTLALYLFM